VRVAELELWEEARELWLRSFLVVAILILNVGDILTTDAVLARGGVEVNPLSAWLIEQNMLASAKIGLSAFIAVAAAAVAGPRRLSTRLAMVAGLYLAVVMANSAQLIFAG
jgi:hypothetical protein